LEKIGGEKAWSRKKIGKKMRSGETMAKKKGKKGKGKE
jgi:hypothetical protein